jgi:hypothetical protein
MLSDDNAQVTATQLQTVSETVIQERNEQYRRTRNTEVPEILRVVKIKTVVCCLFIVTITKLHGVMRNNAGILTYQLPASAVTNCAYNDIVLRHTMTVQYLRYNVGYRL